MSNAPITLDQILPDGIDKALITNPYISELGYIRKGTIVEKCTKLKFNFIE